MLNTFSGIDLLHIFNQASWEEKGMWPGNETGSGTWSLYLYPRRGVDNIHIFTTCRIHSGNFDLASKGYCPTVYVI